MSVETGKKFEVYKSTIESGKNALIVLTTDSYHEAMQKLVEEVGLKDTIDVWVCLSNEKILSTAKGIASQELL